MTFRFCKKCGQMTPHKWVKNSNIDEEKYKAQHQGRKPAEVLQCTICKRIV